MTRKSSTKTILALFLVAAMIIAMSIPVMAAASSVRKTIRYNGTEKLYLIYSKEKKGSAISTIGTLSKSSSGTYVTPALTKKGNYFVMEESMYKQFKPLVKYGWGSTQVEKFIRSSNKEQRTKIFGFAYDGSGTAPSANLWYCSVRNDSADWYSCVSEGFGCDRFKYYVDCSSLSRYTYDQVKTNPSLVTVKVQQYDAQGKFQSLTTLKAGRDYRIKNWNSTWAGAASVDIRGLGSYTGLFGRLYYDYEYWNEGTGPWSFYTTEDSLYYYDA